MSYTQIRIGDTIEFIGRDNSTYLRTVEAGGIPDGFSSDARRPDFWHGRTLLNIIPKINRDNNNKNFMSNIIDTIRLKKLGEPNCDKENEKVIVDLRDTIKTLKLDHELELREIRKDHELALKDKEQELRHFANEEIKKLNGQVETVTRENAVLKKENEMMNKITEINADIVDVKSLVNKLIEKLPSINLNSLTVQANGNSDK